MRLTTKLSLILTALSSVVLAGTLGLLYFSEHQHLLREFRKTQEIAAEKLARVCGESIMEDSDIIRLSYLKTLWDSAVPGLLRYAAFIDARGKILMHSDFLRDDFSKQNKAAADPLLIEVAAGDRVSWRQSRSEWILAAPVLASQKRLGVAAIAYDPQVIETSISRVQRETLRRFAGIFLVGLALSVLAAAALAAYLARPIRALALGSRKIGEGEFAWRIPVDRKDELGELARDFNAMGQKLGELEELKDSFLAKITHDLRNPLGAITGFIDVILMGLQGPVSDEHRKSLQIVLSNAHFLADLINNILDMTKLEAGRMSFVKARLDANLCAGAVLDLLKVKADEFGVRLENAVPKDCFLVADEQALRRVFTNLASNALKFTPKGGAVAVGWRGEKDSDVFFVKDSGIGIPEDKLGSLFQKFSQVQETRDVVRESRGTGLGLVICKEIVEGHGGKIWVESRFRHGTTFFFSLPKIALPAPTAADNAGASVAAGATGSPNSAS